MRKETKIVIRTMLVASIIMLIFRETLVGSSNYPYLKDMESIPFTEFNEHAQNNDINTVYYDKHLSDMYVEMSDGSWVIVSNPDDYNYKRELMEQGIIVKDANELQFGEDKDAEVFHRINILIIAIWVSIIIIVLFRPGRHVISVSGPDSFMEMSPASGYSEDEKNSSGQTNSKVKTFADVAGLKEVKEDIKSLVDFITNKDKYIDAGAKLPKGVILYGPPGTGKTLLAKAIAGEANVEFLYMSGSDFIEMYVGVGAKRVRELFNKARKKAPCIVFIDEIDSIGRSRSIKTENAEDRKTINALLTEMDGFNESDNIIVIGATNRIEDLDPALMRPGRFTDKFCVPIPQTMSERKEVINLYMKNKRFGDDVVVDDMAKEASGFSPAQIESWINEAAIIQVQKDKKYINKQILDEAMSKLLIQGHIKRDQSERNESELRTVSWHEAGHAILGKLLGSTISKVTILSSTSGAGGITFSTPKDNKLLSIRDMEIRVMELYGGIIGELLLNNGDEQAVTVGASNDIEKATDIIHSMVVSYGMTKEFGLLNLERVEADKDYIINKEVEIAKRLEKKAIELLTKNYDSLKILADKLLEQNTVYGKDIDLLNLEK